MLHVYAHLMYLLASQISHQRHVTRYRVLSNMCFLWCMSFFGNFFLNISNAKCTVHMIKYTFITKTWKQLASKGNIDKQDHLTFVQSKLLYYPGARCFINFVATFPFNNFVIHLLFGRNITRATRTSSSMTQISSNRFTCFGVRTAPSRWKGKSMRSS